MSYKVSDELAEAILAAVSTELDDGFLYIFNGTVPATPATVLDMVSTHTLLVQISIDGAGVTGLTFAAPDGDSMAKTEAEAWEGTAAFSGAQDSETTLAANFFRYCKAADNGQGAGTTSRLQGTIGATGSGSDMERLNPDIVEGNPVEIVNFIVRVSSIG